MARKKKQSTQQTKKKQEEETQQHQQEIAKVSKHVVQEESAPPHQWIDSLAYIDVQYGEDAQLRSTVRDYVETEMAVMAYDTDEEIQRRYLSHLTSVDELCRGKKYISMEKYEPIQVIPQAKERLSRVPESLEELKVQFEYQRDRLLNLQLMERYGVQAWRAYGDSLEMIKRYWQTEGNRRKERVHAVNMKRRHEQTEMAKKLQNLSHRWKESSRVVLDLMREKDIVESQNKRMRLDLADNMQQQQQVVVEMVPDQDL